MPDVLPRRLPGPWALVAVALVGLLGGALGGAVAGLLLPARRTARP